MKISFYTTTDSLAGMFSTHRAMMILHKHKVKFELKGTAGDEYLVIDKDDFLDYTPSGELLLPKYIELK